MQDLGDCIDLIDLEMLVVVVSAALLYQPFSGHELGGFEFLCN